MIIRLGYEIEIECVQPTPLVSLLEIRSERQADIIRQTPVETTPTASSQTYLDLHGNVCRRFVAPTGPFRIRYDASVNDSGEHDTVNTLAKLTPVDQLPPEAIVFLLGSRYCETDLLSSMAWSTFGHIEGGWARVQAICDYVHNQISFGYGYARATRTAAQAHDERVGVCRDFAHLAITLCRCVNVPARYINGYLGDIGVPADPAPMDFSAWFEAYLDGKWYAFDARHNIPRIGRIPIARGRDATDVPLLHTFGQHQLKLFNVWAYDETNEGTGTKQQQSQLIDHTMTAQILA